MSRSDCVDGAWTCVVGGDGGRRHQGNRYESLRLCILMFLIQPSPNLNISNI